MVGRVGGKLTPRRTPARSATHEKLIRCCFRRRRSNHGPVNRVMRFPQLPSFTFFAEIKFSVGTIPPTLHGSKSSHGETADRAAIKRYMHMVPSGARDTKSRSGIGHSHNVGCGRQSEMKRCAPVVVRRGPQAPSVRFHNGAAD